MRSEISQSWGNLPNLPPIWAGEPAWNPSLSDPMQLDVGFITEPLIPSPYFLDCVDGDTEPPLTGEAVYQRSVKGGWEVHGSKVELSSTQVNTQPPIHFIHPEDTYGMADREWEKRPVFLQWVEDAKALLKIQGHKGTKVEVALLMDLAPNSMKKYTAEKWEGAKPGAPAMRLLGDFLGRDYRLLMDGSDVAPEGIPQADWDAAPAELKGFTVKMFYQGRALAPEQLRAVEAMVKAGRELGRERRARGE